VHLLSEEVGDAMRADPPAPLVEEVKVGVVCVQTLDMDRPAGRPMLREAGCPRR